MCGAIIFSIPTYIPNPFYRVSFGAIKQSLVNKYVTLIPLRIVYRNNI